VTEDVFDRVAAANLKGAMFQLAAAGIACATSIPVTAITLRTPPILLHFPHSP
jgi:hypothetical protein